MTTSTRHCQACAIEGLEPRPVRAQWLCSMHYQQAQRQGVLESRQGRWSRPAEERFWEKVDRQGSDECWPWKASRHANGYGKFGLHHPTVVYAHRYAYELLIGPIPAGLALDHLCHNADRSCPGKSACQHRRCVNPTHLEPVTNEENLRRSAARVTHCPRGHPYDEQNTRIIRGARTCRICGRAAKRQAYAKAKLRGS